MEKKYSSIEKVLDNVRSANNVGSILRSAETAGLAEVLCCGITPHPPHPKLSKTALGAAESVPTRHFESTHDVMKVLKEEGYTIYGMETSSRSVCYTDVAFPKKTALVLGNEVH
jgi:23S rRNA (guanosine2251-2'-O)-methyltransferase